MFAAYCLLPTAYSEMTMRNGPTTKTAPNADTMRQMLYYLKLTREAEWRIEQVLYRQGKIVGGVYVGRGQEAIGVGAAWQMREGDVTLPCHRDFAVFLIRGFHWPIFSPTGWRAAIRPRAAAKTRCTSATWGWESSPSSRRWAPRRRWLAGWHGVEAARQGQRGPGPHG